MNVTTSIEAIEVALRGELNARAVGLRSGRPPVPRIMAAARRDRTRRRAYAGTGFVLVAALIAASAPAAPGLPPFQVFIRGLASGAPANDSPPLAQSFVRPSKPLIPGQPPTTAAIFGGTPESTTIGAGLSDHW